MSRAPTPELRKATQRHVRAVTEAVHSGLLDWIRGALHDADLHEIEVTDHFVGDPTRPTLVVYPFRMGPEKMLDHNEAGRSLMARMAPVEEALVPRHWRQLGVLTNETLQSIMPTEKRGGRVMPSRRPLVTALPPMVQAWYEAQPAEEGWIVDAPDGRRAMVPNIWWHSTFPVDFQYMLCGVTSESVDSHVGSLLPALTAARTAVHLSGVLNLTLPPIPSPESMWSFLYALLNSIDDDNLDAPEPEDFEEAIELARQPFGTQIGVVPSQHVEDRSLFVLMGAVKRPLHATLCLRVRVGIGQRVAFEPGSDFAPNVGKRPN